MLPSATAFENFCLHEPRPFDFIDGIALCLWVREGSVLHCLAITLNGVITYFFQVCKPSHKFGFVPRPSAHGIVVDEDLKPNDLADSVASVLETYLSTGMRTRANSDGWHLQAIRDILSKLLWDRLHDH